MNHRERLNAVLHYQPYDALPIVHFGFLDDTMTKWAEEGHITEEEAHGWADSNVHDLSITEKLGFDFNYRTLFAPASDLMPPFKSKVIAEFPDGSKHVLNGQGLVILHKPDTKSIQPDVDHLLKDRNAWEELYKPKLQFAMERVASARVRVGDEQVRFDEGADEFLRRGERDYPIGLRCGSLYGDMRTWLTMEGACYLLVDDEPLFDEIVETNAELRYQCVKAALDTGAQFDFAHFWEDICFKNGPLISPKVFSEKMGPHYKRITELINSFGIDIVSLDCDGWIDALVPTWFENGVNTMFPIEVGTWGGSIAPWREQFGKELRGVGGMDKKVFAKDFAAVDTEIERLKPLVELGGFVPCPDHRIAEDAEWDNVRYYCDRMREVFGG